MIEPMKRIQPIVDSDQYREILGQLQQREHGRIYCRHGLPHLLDVARIAALLAMERGAPYPHDVVYAAALLHDIGRLQQYETKTPHASAGVPVARQILRETAFTAEEQAEILKAVGGHQTGGCGDLTQLICEADHASRMCFACAAQDTCHWPAARRNQTILR